MREINMGMKKDEFIENMMLLNGAFPRNCFSEENVLDTWWKFFSKYDPDIFNGVINDWIMNNEKAPTIANIKPECTKAQVHKYRLLEKEDDVPVNTYINSGDWYGK